MKTEYKLLTYADDEGIPRGGLLIGSRIFDAATTLNRVHQTKFESLSVLDVLREWDTFIPLLDMVATRVEDEPEVSAHGMDVANTKLLAPIQFPDAIFGAGANFSDHVEEMRRAFSLPEEPSPRENGGSPWFFIKSPTPRVIVGPGAQVKLPAYAKSVDYEVELAAVIGRSARNVSASEALGYVAGYTIANDLSARDGLWRTNFSERSPFRFDWVSHKCFDGSCPIGPWITPAKFVGDPQELEMKLWLNEEIRQDGSTSSMIFSVAEQVAFLSSRTTLQPGDIILTGTPAGVGSARGEFLKAGDSVRIWIEKIGEMRHSLV
ncbi:2-keto-4-pentenoate hydratase/2-oxohepta-3-ene-1,7-dioic acid hydratase (catechol pathway) [Paraburkholderia steynii]|uniref:2-keto-4-pentenoate hydratase/2-oxohepta-3-ene-1,7-dioic acid hydratase (Catechol pathway) n=1 Tax=Paraburkholderia steynii TaxID=1245441 RepID=A0A7Z7FJY4_9BURK|nr:fumarylacetoacetate hydrolase family protein [Paraburkholderia steynii]SDI69780.1 2-keto-4-pentenoate hydratase/2-oxohepta-3-ene-1,7-dioic acid hydratase (catechol pathway) [Paraburkholderia steynii]